MCYFSMLSTCFYTMTLMIAAMNKIFTSLAAVLFISISAQSQTAPQQQATAAKKAVVQQGAKSAGPVATPPPTQSQTQTQSNTSVVVPNSGVPASFPKYIDTGNPEQDRQTYAAAKRAWIQQHPEEYKALKNK